MSKYIAFWSAVFNFVALYFAVDWIFELSLPTAQSTCVFLTISYNLAFWINLFTEDDDFG